MDGWSLVQHLVDVIKLEHIGAYSIFRPIIWSNKHENCTHYKALAGNCVDGPDDIALHWGKKVEPGQF